LDQTTTLERPQALPLSVKAYREEIERRQREAMLAEVDADADGIRQRCRKFAEFVKLAWRVIEPVTPLKWNWHLQAMCDHLEAISRGKLKPRLIINVPPGSSKSTIVSVLWQAYEWGPLGRPHLRYVSTSFDLANVKRDTGKTLDLVKSEWFQELWPTALKTEGVLSFSNWDTGSRMGVAFKSVTGKRGDRLIVDDPHSVDGAESETQRDNSTRRFIEGGLNRTNDWETSAIVIVMQRLHSEDLTGVLLARDYGFVHLCIPMEWEPGGENSPRSTPLPWTDPRSSLGELMDPVRVPPEAVIDLQKSGEYMWAGQYQQRPAPREGGMFKVENINIVSHCPPGGRTVAGWDFAGSKRKKSAFTVRVLMTRIGGDIYVRHVERRRANPTEVEAMLLDVSEGDRDRIADVRISIPQDPGFGGKAFKWRASEILLGFDYICTPETGDKETRAEPFAAQVGAERVHLVAGAWNAEYIDELRNFPSGTFKDQVDASSRAFTELLNVPPEPILAGPEEMRLGGYRGAPEAVFEGDPWDA
jgi:predicted phage terminase large subunit-like protein